MPDRAVISSTAKDNRTTRVFDISTLAYQSPALNSNQKQQSFPPALTKGEAPPVNQLKLFDPCDKSITSLDLTSIANLKSQVQWRLALEKLGKVWAIATRQGLSCEGGVR